METWATSTKRFGIACFHTATPANPRADGEGEFFNSRSEAIDRIENLLTVGKVKYIVLWDGDSGNWEWDEDFSAGDFES